MKITLSYCNESTYVSGSRPLFGAGQRRDRKIKRIEIVPDRWVVPMLCFVNDRRHSKEEDEEVGSRDNRIVIAPHEREVTLHATYNEIGAKQAKHAESAKKAKPIPADRDQERDDDCYV